MKWDLQLNPLPPFRSIDKRLRQVIVSLRGYHLPLWTATGFISSPLLLSASLQLDIFSRVQPLRVGDLRTHQ